MSSESFEMSSSSSSSSISKSFNPAIFGGVLKELEVEGFVNEFLTKFNLTTDNEWVKSLLKDKVVTDNVLDKPIGIIQWEPVWLTFAIYAAIIAIAFAILFKHKHNPKDVSNISH